MITKCKSCGKRMKCRMFSNNYLVKWYDCTVCNKSYKRMHTMKEMIRIGVSPTFAVEYEGLIPVLIEINQYGKVCV